MGSGSGGGFVAGEEDAAACDFGLGLSAGGEGFPASSAGSGVASIVQGFDPSCFKSWVNSSGGGILMGFGGGSQTRPFTDSQRQEFERQTDIFKCMAASIPIPPELLIPMNSKFPSQLSYQSNDTGGRNAVDHSKYGGVNRDAEPWRCRRTDGKKWRCSKDVAPDQKYCERHSHKSRPSRSRKHVESPTPLSSISEARMTSNNVALMPSSTSSAVILPQRCPNPPQYANPRFPDWFIKREAAAHHDSSFFPQTQLHQTPDSHSHSLPPHSLSGGGFIGNHPNDPSHTPPPRQFLDAWSIKKSGGIGEITSKPAVSTSSLLTLSMAGGGIGIDDSGEFDSEREREGERYAWMGASGPGGPLAEALCLGMVGAGGGRGGARGSSGHGHGESSQGLGFMK